MAKPPDLSFWLLFGRRKNEKKRGKEIPKADMKITGKTSFNFGSFIQLV